MARGVETVPAQHKTAWVHCHVLLVVFFPKSCCLSVPTSLRCPCSSCLLVRCPSLCIPMPSLQDAHLVLLLSLRSPSPSSHSQPHSLLAMLPLQALDFHPLATLSLDSDTVGAATQNSHKLVLSFMHRRQHWPHSIQGQRSLIQCCHSIPAGHPDPGILSALSAIRMGRHK